MSGIVGSSHNIRGSGIIAKLGTDGQVFTSAGAGIKQTYEAAGGGAWNVIATQTASASASVEFDGNLDDTYRVYKIICDHWVGDTDGPYLNFTFKRDGESSYNTGASDYKWVSDRLRTGSNLGTRVEDTSDAVMRGRNNLGNQTGAHTGFETIIWPRTGEYPTIHTIEIGFDSGPDLIWAMSVGTLLTEADCQSIKIAPSTGEITTGNFVLYGLSIS